MSRTRILRDVLAALGEVGWRRLRGGRLHPEWTFGYEVTVCLLRRAMRWIPTLTPPQQRAAWEALVPPSPSLRKVRQTPCEVGGVPAVWLDPPDAAPDGAVVLYLHGGGMVHGSLRTHAELVARLALAARARILFVAYRLAPEHPYPAGLDDAKAAWSGLQALGIPARRIVVAGDSAGGNLTLSLLVALRDAGGDLPAGGVLVCPWVDVDAEGGSIAENAELDWIDAAMLRDCRLAYLGDGAAPPLASPGHADLAHLPPVLAQVGGAEIFHDQVVAMAARARAAGTDVTLQVFPGMAHVWHAGGLKDPHVRPAIDAIAGFVRVRASA
jgi:acetyl esterase/lipase